MREAAELAAVSSPASAAFIVRTNARLGKGKPTRDAAAGGLAVPSAAPSAARPASSEPRPASPLVARRPEQPPSVEELRALAPDEEARGRG